MSIRYLLPLVAMLALLMIACQQDSNSTKEKTAVVDMMRVMRDSAPGKAGVKYLEGIQADMQKKLDGIQSRLEKDPKDEAAMQDLQKVYASSQQRMQAEQQNVVNMLNDTIQRVLNAYRDSHGLEVILASDAAMAYSPKIDVTSAIITEVDKQKLEFTPIPETPQSNADQAVSSSSPEAASPEQSKSAATNK